MDEPKTGLCQNNPHRWIPIAEQSDERGVYSQTHRCLVCRMLRKRVMRFARWPLRRRWGDWEYIR